jgi:SAM-dependent methyltransferase
VSDVAFTGERLHEGSQLFGVDLARHRAAYRYAMEQARQERVLDLGCGSGYGAAELSAGGLHIVGIDRVPPDRANRGGRARFVRGDLRSLPLRDACFDWVVSFQVIEHLEDPVPYLDAIARLMRPGGTALLTTPNRLTSDGVNPFHIHEYLAEELEELLRAHFDEVTLLGVGATEPVARYHEARLRNIRRILRLDPLRLRDRLPRALVQWLFGRLALVVRRRIRSDEGIPEVTWRDFPIGPAAEDCLDLLAVCRRPRRRPPS